MAIEAILAAKRDELRARKAERPERLLFRGLCRSDRSFVSALGGAAPAFILEIKPASPSEGALRPIADLDPALAAYARHASVVSVLADGPFFGGSLDLVSRVRAAVPQPILCKDFILEPYQVIEARRAGADAVLLMLSVLDDLDYRVCERQAEQLGMGVLTEVHTEEELARAARLGAPVIGINNRDLRTLAVDRSVTRRLAGQAPPGSVLIAESGIRSHADVAALRDVVHGFLVGTALMRADDVDAATRELVFGRTKVCGLTREADAIAAAQAGATHGGLVFAAESSRVVTPRRARELRRAAPLEWVGVFVNDAPRRIAELAQVLDLAAVQLHGDETADDVGRLRPLLPDGCEVWQAVPVRDRIPTPEETGADRVLLDASVPGRRGGTGRQFDWSLLERLDRPERYILSGGLAPDSVYCAVTLGIPFLDVSSGVESGAGLKDAALLARFFAGRRGGRRWEAS